jgi:hypothetical protein
MSISTKLYRLSSSEKVYLIDSDVFMSIKSRDDAPILFAGILNLAKAGYVKTVRQVFKEMKHDPILKTEILPHKKLLEIKTEDQYCAEVAAKITLISDQAAHLWPQTGGTTSDPADPWLIAVASHYGYCLVTNENKRSTKKIPAACKIPGATCECISGPHFFYATGIVTAFDPAHIFPADFFNN